MLINVVNFLLFAHISFGIVRCLNLVAAAYRSFALLCRPLALALALSLTSLTQLIQWKVHDMAIFCCCCCAASCWFFAAFIWRSAGFTGGGGGGFRSSWLRLHPHTRTTSINKFIALINNCNTVADCSVNGNGFMKYPSFPVSVPYCPCCSCSTPPRLHFKCHLAKCSLIMLVFLIN